jgi:hypothetical protein
MPDPKCVKDADDTDYSQYIADLCIFTADRLSLRELVLVVVKWCGASQPIYPNMYMIYQRIDRPVIYAA